MPDLSLPNVSLNYEVSGRGPPILMIAGFMSDSASWTPLVSALEPHFTLIRPDNRSTGQTQPWNAPCSLEIWARDACALLDHLGHEHVHVLGHSLGGLIGWALACATPDRVTSLMTLGTAPHMSARNAALFETLIHIRNSNAPPDTWLRVLFPWLFASDLYETTPDAIEAAIAGSLSYPHAQSADAMAHQLDAMRTIDLSALTMPPPVRQRALLGANDLLIPLDTGQAALKGIDTVVIPDAGHSLHWDAPAAVSTEILAFFKTGHA